MAAWSAVRWSKAARRAILAFLVGLASGHAGATSVEPLRLEQFYHSSWSTQAGAPRDIQVMTQAADGTLWMGTDSGLYNFNGLRFSSLDLRADERQIASSPIWSLYSARNGSLWVGFSVKGIAEVRDRKIVRYFDERSGLPLGQARQVLEGPDNRLIAIVSSDALTLDGDRWIPFIRRDAVDGERFQALLYDREGALWIATDKSYWLRRPGQTSLTRLGDAGPVSLLFQAPDGAVWGTSGARGKTIQRLRSPAGGPDEKLTLNVGSQSSNFLVDSDGRVWVGTDRGVDRYASTSSAVGDARSPVLDHLGSADGLSSERILWILQSITGEVWIGTNRGLDRFERPRAFTFFEAPDRGANALAQCPHGPLWIGTQDQPLRATDGRVTTSLGPVRASVFELACDPAGTVWLADEVGFWHLENGHFSHVALPPGIPDNWIRKVVFDRRGRMFASIIGHGLWVRTNDAWSQVADSPITPYSMFVDHLDRLWIGYPDNRIAILDDRGVRFLAAGQDNAVGIVEVIAETSYGILIGGSNGVSRYVDGRLIPLATIDSIGLRGVSGILEGVDGDLWLNGLRGVVKISAAEMRASIEQPGRPIDSELLNEAGIVGPASQVRPLPSAVKDAKGRLWFATSDSLIHIDEAKVARPPPPQLTLVSTLADDVPLATQGSVNHGVQTVRIQYIGVNLYQPEKVVYRYKLDGLDQRWQDAGSRTEAVYTHLPPGTYRFHVMASNGDGAWTASDDSLGFSVNAAFYQTRWFFAAAVLTFLFLFWATTFTISARKNADVRRSYEHRAEERVRIARDLHDTLLQGVQGLILHVHVAAQKLAATADARVSLERALATADDLLTEGRDRVGRLRSEQPPSVDLRAALDAVAADFHASPTRISIDQIGQERPLDVAVYQEAFSIAREAMTNALRHARAAEVTVRIEYRDTAFQVAVRDDGQGFDVQSMRAHGPNGHWGLQGMFERAVQIGGSIDAQSEMSVGTVITLTVPARRAYGRRLSLWETWVKLATRG